MYCFVDKKMARSRTRKKSAEPSPPELKVLTSGFTDYLKQWTNKELTNLQADRKVICLPVKNGYKIGYYNLRVFPNKTTEVWDQNDELVHAFHNKVSAVLYAIYNIKRQFWVADDILRLDQEINKNNLDIMTMRRCMNASIARKDYNSADIRQARLDTAQLKLVQAQHQLQAIHRRAKIAKVWE